MFYLVKCKIGLWRFKYPEQEERYSKFIRELRNKPMSFKSSLMCEKEIITEIKFDEKF